MSNLNNEKTAKENAILSWIVSALILLLTLVSIFAYDISMNNAYLQGKIYYYESYSDSEECSDEVLHW